jgi:hypothetical protein
MGFIKDITIYPNMSRIRIKKVVRDRKKIDAKEGVSET